MTARPCCQARPGVALMLVLWIIVVLGTIGSGVALATRSTTDITANYRARVVARYAAENGIVVAVIALEDSLATVAEGAARRTLLNGLEGALGRNAHVTLGDARTDIALIDPASRLDVNFADVGALTTLFTFFTDALQAESVARAIRAYISGTDPSGGSEATLQDARPLRSLDDLIGMPGVPRELAERALPFLTVDGDGTINRVTASDTVLAAARGELRDEPSRIIVVSRGWLDGHPLTHEIQALYAIVGQELTLIRWQERDL